MRILLLLLGLMLALPLQAGEPPLEFTLSRAGAAPIAFQPVFDADGTARVALADLTRGWPKSAKLPPDMELEVRTVTFGPWMTVNLALYGTRARGERRVSQKGVAIAMPVTERHSTHRSVELRAGESAQMTLESVQLSVKRPGAD